MPRKADAERLLIATRLRQARQAAGLSQEQVSRLLGIHRPSVSEFEAGRRRVGAEELSKLAEIYHVSVDWLTSDKDDIEGLAPIKMAARELSSLSDEDLARLMEAIKMIKSKNV